MNMQKYWFKPKKYGYGFSPISWEGWLLTIVLLGLVLILAYINDMFLPNIKLKNGLRFFFDISVVLLLFGIIFRDRTDGDIKWRWGNKK